MNKKMYEAPEAEQMELECPVLMAGTPVGEGEPEDTGVSDKEYSGGGL